MLVSKSNDYLGIWSLLCWLLPLMLRGSGSTHSGASKLSVQFFEFKITELNPVALSFEAKIASLHVALLELTRDRAVDPKGQNSPASRNFERVPLSGGFDAHIRHFRGQIKIFLAVAVY